MTKQPFAFVRDGKFSYPELKPFISLYGLKHLNSVVLSADEKKAVEALNSAVQSLIVKSLYSTNMSNDAPRNQLEKIPNWENKGWSGEYYNSNKKSYTVVDLSAWYKKYSSEIMVEGVTSQSKTWGWDALKELHIHIPALRKLSKKHNVSIEVKLIDRILKHQQSLDAQEMSLRIPDSLSDFGRAEGFAVFMDNGYADFQWFSNTIEKAKLFGSEKLAREAMVNNRCPHGIVVKVETVIKEIVDFSESSDALREALALLQKERLDHALQTAELETLRAHVARMEGQITTEVKRKM